MIPAASAPRTPTFTPFQPLQPTIAQTQAAIASESPSDATQPESTQLPPSPPQAIVASPPSEQLPLKLPGQSSLWIDPRLPEGLRTALALPSGVIPAGGVEGADLRLEPGVGAVVSQWIYALVAPFPTLARGVSSEELRQAWSEGPPSDEPFAGRPLLVDESTRGMLSAVWGEPAPGAVQVLPSNELLETAWGDEHAWGIVPFEALEPRWAVLEVDGQSPLRKDFDPAAYPLVAPISLSGGAGASPTDTAWILASNRDPNRLTTLAMTGVTALVRATAFTMEQRGVK